MKPITPQEVIDERRKSIPPEMFEVVNDLLKENLKGSSCSIKEKTIISTFLRKYPRRFDNAWLDFEEDYRDAGWKVVYDQPSYNETYDAVYKFSKV